MLKKSLLMFSWLSLILPTLAQDEQPLDARLIPLRGANAAAFVPKGWQIEHQLPGDLNGDGQADLVLELIQPMPPHQPDAWVNRSRALVILFKGLDGQFQRAAVATRLLQCTSCGGAFYGVAEAPAHVRIEKGVLIVEQDHGSRNLTHQLYRFRYAATSRQFILIGYDLQDHDRLTGENISASTNFLTGLKLVTVTQYDPQTDKELPKINTRQQVAKKRLSIEQVNHEMEL